MFFTNVTIGCRSYSLAFMKWIENDTFENRAKVPELQIKFAANLEAKKQISIVLPALVLNTEVAIVVGTV